MLGSTYLKIFLVALCVPAAFGQSPDTRDRALDPEQCVAQAVADTTPNTAEGEAFANAVAQTLTKSVVCEEGVAASQADVTGLSVAVAFSISESRTLGQECSAEADATADIFTETITGRYLDELDGAAEVLGAAWLDARGDDIREIVRAAEEEQTASVFDEEGCLDVSAFSQELLPTATEVGELLGQATSQILTAINCGTNVTPTDEPCTFSAEEKRFFGNCLGDVPPPKKTREDCRREFKTCKKSAEECAKQFTSCWREAAFVPTKKY